MPQNIRWRIQDERGRRRKKRERSRARKRPAMQSRFKKLLKALVVVAVLAMLLVFALVVGDSDYHATAIGWVPFIAAILIIVFSYAYVQILSRSLAYNENARLSDCQRGKQVPFLIHLENKSPLVFFKLEVGFFISDLFGNVAYKDTLTLALGPHEVYDLEFMAQFDHIGTYEAGMKTIVIGDLLGLFQRTIGPLEHGQVDVTPQLQILEQVNFEDEATVETSRASKSVLADSMDYAQVREYEMGDPLKTIHWKLSARTDTYMTRLYEVYKDPGVAVIMNFCGNSEEAATLMSMFDAVVESAFSIAEFTRMQDMDTEVHFTNCDGEPEQAYSWGVEEMPELISRMPKMTNSPDANQDALKILRRQIGAREGQSTLVLCSASFDSELLSALIDAKNQRRSPFLVAVVPGDLDGRALDAYCKPLAQLDSAAVPYVVISRSEEMGAKLR